MTISHTISPLRILLVGDYSNMHSQLARTLRDMGHDVTVMSEGSGFQDTARDIDIPRRGGRAGGAMLAARLMWPLHGRMRGYDIVALQNPHFFKLGIRRLRYFFDRLKGENGRVFLTAAGTDEFYVREALDPASPLLYNEYRTPDGPAPYPIESPGPFRRWQDADMQAYAEHVYDRVDGIVTGLYEYHVAVTRQFGGGKIFYGGIPIDTAALEVYDIPAEIDCVKFFLGRHRGRYAEKGTGLLEEAAGIVGERHKGRSSLSIIENRPFAEYVGTMRDSHVVLDQIYSYSPATNAMIAMAHGLNVVSGGEPDFYDFVENMSAGSDRETMPRPIINAPVTLDGLVETLDEVVRHPELIRERGLASRRFVERHNDARLVARRFLQAWTKGMQ